MKIGILSYFGDMNSGTNLQALAVTSIVSSAYPGAEVALIDYHPFQRRWKPYLTGFSARSLWLDAFRLRRYARFVEGLPLTGRKLVSGSRDEATEFVRSFGFDALFVGSDTLLELHRHQGDGLTAFWLDPSLPCRKVFIAPSSREVEFGTLTPLQREQMAACLEGIDHISARDAATRRLFLNFVPESRVTMLPDPTFAMPIDPGPAERYWSSRRLDRIGRPVACMHMHRRDADCDAVADGLRKAGYAVASLRPAPYADILLNDIGPLEVAGVFRKFAFVVTHRFHDSIFCFRNGTPVLAYPPPDYHSNSAGESKFRSLFEMFGLEATNLIPEFSEFGAERILSMRESAISAFESARPAIVAKLEENAEAHRRFAASTRVGAA